MDILADFIEKSKELYHEALYLYQYYPNNFKMTASLYFGDYDEALKKMEKYLEEEKDGEASRLGKEKI